MAEGLHGVKSIIALKYCPLTFCLQRTAFFGIDSVHVMFRQNIRRENAPAFGTGGAKGAILLKEIEVKVIDNDIEKAMRILKKKIQNDGLFKRLKLKKSYEKPSEHRRRKQREAQRRERIAAARAARRR
jgi:small subunit ribosomal protein S21